VALKEEPRMSTGPPVIESLGDHDYLTRRQRPDDPPGDLDLQDVAAAYDDYVDQLRAVLAEPHHRTVLGTSRDV
jgi:hypothetical protein